MPLASRRTPMPLAPPRGVSLSAVCTHRQRQRSGDIAAPHQAHAYASRVSVWRVRGRARGDRSRYLRPRSGRSLPPAAHSPPTRGHARGVRPSRPRTVRTLVAASGALAVRGACFRWSCIARPSQSGALVSAGRASLAHSSPRSGRSLASAAYDSHNRGRVRGARFRRPRSGRSHSWPRSGRSPSLAAHRSRTRGSARRARSR